jgi:hypothetical protein
MPLGDFMAAKEGKLNRKAFLIRCSGRAALVASPVVACLLSA